MAVIPFICRTLTWLLLLTSLGVRAEAPLILLSDTGSSYTSMVTALQRHYGEKMEVRAFTDFDPTTEQQLLLAVGSRACATALDELAPQRRLFCLFLPAQTFQELTANTHGQALLDEQRLGALFLDQPLARQMRLAQLIKPDMKSIGTVIGPDNANQAQVFEQQALALGLEPVIGYLPRTENPVQVLSPIISDSDLFLPLPDRSVFNRAAAKWILYITLRKGVPLLGFSARYADAGAVVALYSDIDGLARQAVEILKQPGKQLPPPGWPQDFSININYTAARNLGLNLPPVKQLIEQLRAQEGQ